MLLLFFINFIGCLGLLLSADTQHKILKIILIMSFGLLLAIGNFVHGFKTATEYIKETKPKEPIIKMVDFRVYNAIEGQTDSTPLITADGTKITPENRDSIVAVSRDLLAGDFPHGTKVKIVCNCPYDGQIRVVHDTTHERWINRVDILTDVPVGSFWGVIIKQ